MRLILSLLLLTIGNALWAQTETAALPLFDRLNNQHGAINQKNIEYLQYAVHSEDLNAIVKKRLELILLVEETRSANQGLDVSAAGQAMLDEFLAILDIYHASFQRDFEHIEELKVDSRESYEAMQQYIDAQTTAEKTLAEAAERFLTAQRAYAGQHNIVLLESDRDSEVTQLNRLNAYQRSLYLRSFRLAKTNADFLAAMQRKDVPEMRRLRNKLVVESADELVTLQRFPDYRGNTAYRDAIITYARFLNEMAEKDYPVLIKVNEVEQTELTAADVEAYNAIATKINEDFNAHNATIQQQRDELMRQNVPKPAIQTKRI